MAPSWFTAEGWKRIHNGNLVKEICAKRCTIVWIRGGGYRWCIAHERQVTWSGEKFLTEEAACTDLRKTIR